MKPYSSLHIARYFLEKSKELSEPGLSLMKIIKLVYLAEGWHLGIYGKRLIKDDIQAWKYGPVVPTIYDVFKEFAKEGIPFDISQFLPKADFDENETRFLDFIWRSYGKYSEIKLSALTHADNTPWYNTWNGERDSRLTKATISKIEIKNHYKDKWQNIVSRSSRNTVQAK